LITNIAWFLLVNNQNSSTNTFAAIMPRTTRSRATTTASSDKHDYKKLVIDTPKYLTESKATLDQSGTSPSTLDGMNACSIKLAQTTTSQFLIASNITFYFSPLSPDLTSHKRIHSYDNSMEEPNIKVPCIDFGTTEAVIVSPTPLKQAPTMTSYSASSPDSPTLPGNKFDKTLSDLNSCLSMEEPATTPAISQDKSILTLILDEGPTNNVLKTPSAIATTTSAKMPPPTYSPKTSTDYLAIKNLHPKLTNPWKVRAVVIAKGSVINYSTQRRNGQHENGSRYSFTILDESGVTMRVTGFRDTLSQIYDTVKVANVYTFENAVIKEMKYSDSCAANYEMMLTFRSSVHPNAQTTVKDIKNAVSVIEKDIISISNLTMNTYNWLIFARVTDKSPKKFYQTSSGKQGQLFNVVLADTTGSHIRGTFFMEAVDKFYDTLEFGKLYTFSDANLVTPDKRYSNAALEIKFNINSKIDEVDIDPNEPLDNAFTNKMPYTMISSLLPNDINNWPICARVIEKSRITLWENERKDGLLFNVKLIDSSGTDISAAFFDNAVDLFFDVIEIGNAYVLSGGTVREKRYPDDCASLYSIVFNTNSIVNHFAEMNPSTIDNHSNLFNFQSLMDLSLKQNNHHKYDVMAIAVSIGPLSIYPSNPSSLDSNDASSTNPPENQYCEISVLDHSVDKPSTIIITGEIAAQVAAGDIISLANPIVTFCPISIYSNKSDLNKYTLVGQLFANPTGDLAENLTKWWKQCPLTLHHLPLAGQTQHAEPAIVATSDHQQNNSVTNVKNKNNDKNETSISNIDNSKSWTICGRVFHKSDISVVRRNNSQLHHFSICILDSSGIDILGRFESETVVKQFYDIINVGNVYNFGNAIFVMANPYTSSGCLSNYEIVFGPNSIVTHIPVVGINPAYYNIQTLKQVQELPKGKTIKADIIAIVKSVGDVIVNERNNKKHCNLVITDDSGLEYTVTLWNQNATEAPLKFLDHPVVGFFPVRKKGIGGNVLTAEGQIVDSPPMDRTEILTNWWSENKTH
jgi:hypothetical protein